MERNICSTCHVAFDKQIKKCPVCGREVIKENKIAFFPVTVNIRRTFFHKKTDSFLFFSGEKIVKLTG